MRAIEFTVMGMALGFIVGMVSGMGIESMVIAEKCERQGSFFTRTQDFVCGVKR